MGLEFQPEATFRDPAFSNILSSNRVDPAALLVIAVQDRERGAGKHCRAGFSPYGVNEEGYGGLGSGRIGDDRHPLTFRLERTGDAHGRSRGLGG